MNIKSKLTVLQLTEGTSFAFTSGLRSITDKVLNYAGVSLPTRRLAHLFEVANELGGLMRRVRREDEGELFRSKLTFDAHILLAGRLPEDPAPTAFMIYPQGNWIEIGRHTPYLAIGRSSYALPLLSALVTAELSLIRAFNAGILAVDAASAAYSNVRYPVDVAILLNGATDVMQARLSEVELEPILTHWRNSLGEYLATAPRLDIDLFRKIYSTSGT